MKNEKRKRKEEKGRRKRKEEKGRRNRQKKQEKEKRKEEKEIIVDAVQIKSERNQFIGKRNENRK